MTEATKAERRLIEAAVTWWHTNRALPLTEMPGLLDYYNRPEVRLLVQAAADVAAER